MRNNKRDENHMQIGTTARRLGYCAKDVSMVANFCDWIIFNENRIYFIEVKPEGGTVTEGNAKFMLECERHKTPHYFITDTFAMENLLLHNEYVEPKLYYSKEAKKLLFDL